MPKDKKEGDSEKSPQVVLDVEKIKPLPTPAEMRRELGVAKTSLVPTPDPDLFAGFFQEPESAPEQEEIQPLPLSQPAPEQTGAEVDVVREETRADVEPIGLELDEYLEASGFPLDSPDVKLLKQMFDAKTLTWLIQQKRIEVDAEGRVVKLDVSFRDEIDKKERWVKCDIIDANGDNFQKIGQFTRLQRLNISRAMTRESKRYPKKRMVNLNFLRNLRELEELIAVNCYSEDFSPLKDHKKLKRLDLLNTNLPDLRFLLELAVEGETPDLENLNIGLTPVNDFSTLWICARLKRLNLDYTNGQDITTVGLLKELESLYLYSTGGGWVDDFVKDKDAPDDDDYHPPLHPHREKFIKWEQIDQVINHLPKLILMIAPDGTRFYGEKLVLRRKEIAASPGAEDRSATISLKPRDSGPITRIPPSRPVTLPGLSPVPTPTRSTGSFPRTRTPGRPITMSAEPSVTTTPTMRGEIGNRKSKERPAESTRTPSTINAFILTAVLSVLGLGGVYFLSPEFRERVQRILGKDVISAVSSETKPYTSETDQLKKKKKKGGRQEHEKRVREDRRQLREGAKVDSKPASKPSVAATGLSRRVESPPPAPPEKPETPPAPFQDTFNINVHWGESIDVEVEGGKKCDDFQFDPPHLINPDRIKITIRAKKGQRLYTGATYIEKNNHSDDIAETREILLTPEVATQPGEIEGKPPAQPAGRDQEEGDETGEETFEDEVPDEESEE